RNGASDSLEVRFVAGVNCCFPDESCSAHRLATAQCLWFPPRSGTRLGRGAPLDANYRQRGRGGHRRRCIVRRAWIKSTERQSGCCTFVLHLRERDVTPKCQDEALVHESVRCLAVKRSGSLYQLAIKSMISPTKARIEPSIMRIQFIKVQRRERIL